MAYSQEIRQMWVEAYARTRSKSAACQATGISHGTVQNWRQTDEVFAAAVMEVELELSDLVHNVALERALYGWEEPVQYKGTPVVDPETGETMTRRVYSDRLLLAAAERFAGWKGDGSEDRPPRKEVFLIGPDGSEMSMKALLESSFTRREEEIRRVAEPRGLPAPKTPNRKRRRPSRPPPGADAWPEE